MYIPNSISGVLLPISNWIEYEGGITNSTQLSRKFYSTPRRDGSNVPHERLAQEVVAEEPGYFYIYLSNDYNTGSEAFFDDFTIMTSESYIVQQIDYYPYGMVAREFRRLGDKATNDLFQEDRALRNSPVDCFSEGPACREGMRT